MSKKFAERSIDELFVGLFNEVVSKIPEGVEMPEGVDAELQVIVTGDGGGDYTYSYSKDKQLGVRKGKSDNPVVILSTDVSCVGKVQELGGAEIDKGIEKAEEMGDNPEIVKPLLKMVNAVMPDNDKIDRLRNELSGTIKGVLADHNGNEVFGFVGFGGSLDADDPTVTVKLDQSDLEEIMSGQLNPQQAFMSGRIQIDGDMSLVMQAGMIMMV